MATSDTDECRLRPMVTDKTMMRRTVGLLLIVAFLARLYKVCAQGGFSPELYDSYGFTEFLINYEGGFVRRGLLGQLLYGFCSFIGASPFPVIIVISVAAWAGVLWLFFHYFRKSGYCWWILLSPLFFGYVADIVRKDYLCYLLIIGILVQLRKPALDHSRFVLVVSLSALGMFLHEAFVFYGIPFVVMLLFSEERRRYMPLYLFAVLTVFVVQCVFKGDMPTAERIISSWKALPGCQGLAYNPDNSIGALTWDTLSTVRYHIHENFYDDGTGWYSGIIVRPLLAICAYYMVSNFFIVFRPRKVPVGTEEQTGISCLFVFSLACLLPMFTVLSCDYARLYQYAFVATFAPFMILGGRRIASVFPSCMRRAIERINTCMSRIVRPSKPLMLILLFTLASSRAVYSVRYDLLESLLGTYINLTAKVIYVIKAWV